MASLSDSRPVSRAHHRGRTPGAAALTARRQEQVVRSRQRLKLAVMALSFSLWLTGNAALHAQSAAVPLYHTVYPFLEKLAADLPQHSLALHVIPVDREQVRQILLAARSANLQLSRADQALLEQYLAEFTDPVAGATPPAGAERHFWRHEERGARLFVDVFGMQRFAFQRGDSAGQDLDISRTRAGGRLRAQLPPRLLLAVEVSNSMERGAPDSAEVFTPGRGQPLVLSGGSAFRETAIAYARLQLPWFEIEAGRNQFAWGVSPLTQLALNRENQPFDLVRLDSRWRRFRFVFVHASLRAAQRKFLAAHRLEIMPLPTFLCAVGETVIYGSRGAEFEYLNPLMLYHAAEHLLGDRDNNVLTLDFAWFPRPGLKLYGESFIDDLSLEFPLGTYFGNKLAWLAGAFWTRPLGWRSADLRLEYSRVDPFVYTHEFPQNVYEQDGEALGSRFGPNADRLTLALGWRPHRDLQATGRLHWQRTGRGDLFRAHRPEDGNAKGFLKGTVITTLYGNLALENQIRRDVYLGIELEWEAAKNAGFVTGLTSHRRQAAFTMRVDW
ncbi:MAG: capsule assembly Wzi family protein [candidate division KSB1 bacterium]|nr:capsule assembly Wzi family protein [candidate division KSB1 bacterium]MDZ7274427.1 capsule assembly Wzi family protein [candidate division KSB1 bacterium]MDZ7284911.1 capsule assembly Wzi family protein [candidate division KSB1 bacterium]MDZ7297668.1 capsule assembly Wzi family protein [candidate division KSB1 bacterium]MDZ7305908.1 capsule assembly Wzi family protein [candidate division KSB1 bacterium]